MLGHVVDHVLHQFEARLAINIRIAAVHAHRKRVGDLEVRLRGDDREIEGAVRILHSQLIHPRGRKHRRQAAGERLIANIVVLECGRQIETVVQRRLVGQAIVIDEIAQVQSVLLVEVLIQPDEPVIRVAVAQHKQIFRRQVKDVRFHRVDGGDVVQHCGIVGR